MTPTAAERTLRRRLRTDFRAWCEYALAPLGQMPARHHLAVIAALEALDRGETQRLMLLLPPGAAKSTYASRLFPAWWVARHPASSVILASHTAGLARHFAQEVRRLLSENAARLNVHLRRDARAAGRFLTGAGGEFFAIGVAGAVTGRRADLAVIDDPVRSFADAESGASRERLWNWYCTELLTRLKPNGRVVLVMNRWHCDDLAGRLMDDAAWSALRLPALAELGDPLGRAPGEALWPEWETASALSEKARNMGERGFSALFQQSPLPAGGTMFDTAQLRCVDIMPAGRSVRGWDLASATDARTDPDWTVGVLLSRDESGLFCIQDVLRLRVAPADLGAAISAAAEADGRSVSVALPRDPGQAGAFQTMMLTRHLAGYRVCSSPETGSKESRAGFVAAQVNAGNVRLRRAAWNRLLIDELAAFPNGRKDDQVDALSRAFTALVSEPAPARFTGIPFSAR